MCSIHPTAITFWNQKPKHSSLTYSILFADIAEHRSVNIGPLNALNSERGWMKHENSLCRPFFILCCANQLTFRCVIKENKDRVTHTHMQIITELQRAVPEPTKAHMLHWKPNWKWKTLWKKIGRFPPTESMRPMNWQIISSALKSCITCVKPPPLPQILIIQKTI